MRKFPKTQREGSDNVDEGITSILVYFDDLGEPYSIWGIAGEKSHPLAN
jgi:hypothetical protein